MKYLEQEPKDLKNSAFYAGESSQDCQKFSRVIQNMEFIPIGPKGVQLSEKTTNILVNIKINKYILNDRESNKK